jgi:hypothetical protein
MWELLESLKSDLELEGIEELRWVVENFDVCYTDCRHLLVTWA